MMAKVQSVDLQSNGKVLRSNVKYNIENGNFSSENKTLIK